MRLAGVKASYVSYIPRAPRGKLARCNILGEKLGTPEKVEINGVLGGHYLLEISPKVPVGCGTPKAKT